jgi:hypothetical protein
VNQNLVIGLGIIFCAASVIWLQGRFDTSDHKKGKRLVRTYTTEHRAETFEQFLQAKHGGTAGEWDSEITHDCRGVVRVQWSLRGNPPTVYLWDVEISSQEIYAVEDSPSGERMLREFQSATNELPPLELPPLDR